MTLKVLVLGGTVHKQAKARLKLARHPGADDLVANAGPGIDLATLRLTAMIPAAAPPAAPGAGHGPAGATVQIQQQTIAAGGIGVSHGPITFSIVSPPGPPPPSLQATAAATQPQIKLTSDEIQAAVQVAIGAGVRPEMLRATLPRAIAASLPEGRSPFESLLIDADHLNQIDDFVGERPIWVWLQNLKYAVSHLPRAHAAVEVIIGRVVPG